MRNLSQIIVLLLFPLALFSQGQSPHGDNFNISCDVCHSPESWDLVKKSTFNHDSTGFILTGQHQNVDCRYCHTSLEFSRAGTTCISCHSDIHQNTVGEDCDRCHNTGSWIMNNVMEMHMNSRFPLVGTHATADCYDCHKSASMLRFDPQGVECYDCHKEQFMATTNPNHVTSGFSTECTDCHTMNATTWTTEGFDHSFFPLTEGHNLNDCSLCHKDNNYTNTSDECYSCHAEDFSGTNNPSHVNAGFSQQCEECHTTHPGWSPARFEAHDASYFPVYSGTHNGTWESCTECHTVPGDYTQYSCTACHEHNKADTDEEHGGVSGYSYNDQACFACHPDGSKTGAFNHDLTNFPLTGAHRDAECLSCHTNGYAGTSTVCKDCHTADYIASQNPPHQDLNFPDNCDQCHTTNPGWSPATFAIHDNYYPLRGEHAAIADQCMLCHKDGYTNTPNNCYGCHAQDYNATTDPNHVDAKFPTECEICHTDQGWSPSIFNHDQFYPLIGAHAEIKDNCKLCHADGYTNTPNNCYGCHTKDYNATTEPNHIDAHFPTTCETCHSPNSWTPSTFDHSTIYPLVGAHAEIADNCNACHANGYTNTPNNCYGCHAQDYNATTNPNHTDAQFPTTCETCHNTTGWSPSTFNHDNFYPLTGAHATIADNCIRCHSEGYTNTPSECYGCHAGDYNSATDPNHAAANFPKVCEDCHTTSAWSPSTFNHDAQYFPIYSGAHRGEWNNCIDCHTNASNFGVFSCITCHEHNKTDTDSHHREVRNYVYASESCYSCHPNGRSD
ncbi:hypothetical protein ACE01N_01025 [Saccharicrinis sp. FJH2]|uniref:hypothetical protein n=1 Tax=Saccharicrinis sp. FJH65 TaxID=3344659 RepID=UPI0035F40E01